MIHAASDAGNAAGLVYFIFDLLHLDGYDVSALPLIERKAPSGARISGRRAASINLLGSGTGART